MPFLDPVIWQHAYPRFGQVTVQPLEILEQEVTVTAESINLAIECVFDICYLYIDYEIPYKTRCFIGDGVHQDDVPSYELYERDYEVDDDNKIIHEIEKDYSDYNLTIREGNLKSNKVKISLKERQILK